MKKVKVTDMKGNILYQGDHEYMREFLKGYQGTAVYIYFFSEED